MSRLQSWYLRAPWFGQAAAASCYGALLRFRRYGSYYRDELSLLAQFDTDDLSAVRALQKERLRGLVAHAIRHVPYYRDLSRDRQFQAEDVTPETLANYFPPLDKELVRSDPTRFFSEAFSDRQYVTHSTSGTTGRPLTVRVSREALQRNYAHHAYFLGLHGASVFARSATFAGRTLVSPTRVKPPFWQPNPAMRDTLFSAYHLSDATLPYYIEKLARLQPVYIDSYPSAIYEVASFMLRRGDVGRVKPRLVMTSSECLLPHQREAIEQAFQCPVREQYGAVEMAAFLGEHEDGLLHQDAAFGLIEWEQAADETSGARSFLATGFLNPAMPLIRYRIGDLFEPATESSSFDESSVVIRSVVGRQDDVLVTPDGRRLGRLGPVFKATMGIADCQITQVGARDIIVSAVLLPGKSKNDLAPMLQELAARVGPTMEVTLKTVEQLARTSSGKVRPVSRENY